MASPTATLPLSKTTALPARRFRLREPQIIAFLFLIPALAIFLIFVVWPIVLSARYSLYQWNGVTALENSPFVNLDNYIRLLNDPIFWLALRNNVIVVIWSLITQIPLAIFLAILLTGKIRGSAILRTIYFAPVVLSTVLITVLWGWFYNPTIGLGNAFLRGIGLPKSSWLGDTNLSLILCLVVATWQYLGFYIVIYIAAIQGIPEELYEAARIDGANGFDLHRFITIPLLTGTTRTSAVLIIIGSLKFFDLVWLLTNGGPSNSSELLATYMFKQAFQFKDWSYGSTIAFALFFIAFILAMIFMYITRPRSETDKI